MYASTLDDATTADGRHAARLERAAAMLASWVAADLTSSADLDNGCLTPSDSCEKVTA